MPRIFQVHVIRESDFTIVADSEEELHKALKAADIEDWDMPDWRFDINDPLDRIKLANLDRVSDNPKTPHMGVIDGEVLAYCDVKAERPNILDEVIAEVKEIKRTITLEAVNEKLFP